MRKAALLAVAFLAASASTAWADSCSGHGHAAGSILGAVGGGVVGNAITGGSAVGTVGGAVAGGFAGNAIARDIDCDRGRHWDRRRHSYYWYDHHGHRIYEDRRDERGDRYDDDRRYR